MVCASMILPVRRRILGEIDIKGVEQGIAQCFLYRLHRFSVIYSNIEPERQKMLRVRNDMGEALREHFAFCRRVIQDIFGFIEVDPEAGVFGGVQLLASLGMLEVGSASEVE